MKEWKINLTFLEQNGEEVGFWEVSNGDTPFLACTKQDAEWLCDLLNSQDNTP